MGGPFLFSPIKSDEELKKFCIDYKDELLQVIKDYLLKMFQETKNSFTTFGLNNIEVIDSQTFNKFINEIRSGVEDKDLEDFVLNFFKIIEDKAGSAKAHKKLFESVIKFQAVSAFLAEFDNPAGLNKAFLKHQPMLTPFRNREGGDEKINQLLLSFFKKITPQGKSPPAVRI